MSTRLAQLVIRRRHRVLIVSGLLVLLAAVLGTGVFTRLRAGGFEDPSAESTRAAASVAGEFHSGQPNYVALVDVVDGDLDSPDAVAGGTAITDAIGADASVAQVVSHWSLGGADALRSTEGDSALVVARITGDEDEQLDAVRRIEEHLDELREEHPEMAVSTGGILPATEAVTSTIEDDLARAESIAVPVTLLLLVIVFGGLIAAGLPLLTGAIAVLGTFLTLWVVTLFTDVSIFSINLVTALGLGLAIDYSLFIVSRFREELALRPSSEWRARDRELVEEALVRTMTTAGRTVAFSALTVAVSLAALLVFPLYFLRSFAYAGIGVTTVAMVASVVTLPALLAVLGRRVDSLALLPRRRRGAARPRPATEGFWYRTAMFSQRHAGVVVLVTVGILVLAGLPFTQVAFGVPDQRVLPADDPARVASERVRAEFAAAGADAFPVVLRGAPERLGDDVVGAYAARLATLDGVASVDAPTGRYGPDGPLSGPDPVLAAQRIDAAVLLNVVPAADLEPVSAEGEALVESVRALDAPVGEVLVGGSSAEFHDTKASIAQRLPWALAIIATSTFVLMFLMFGSVLIPLKAIALNVLSLSATFGAMVWVFQWGHGAGLFDFTPTGMTDLTTPILMFCIAFGLSMDYEVFLLSRIAEEHRAGASDTEAVAMGLQRTGRIVTAAAALLSVTFLAFATSGITFIKLFGVGLALAVLMDATVVRGLLVPAVMALAGDANWWAPAWMRRLHERFGFTEGEDRPTGPGVAQPGSTRPGVRASEWVTPAPQ